MINGKDLTIVNAADLEPVALRENVCEQCHFQGRERFELPGRSMFDYRPGLPLEEFLQISSARIDPTLRDVAVGHVEQIRQSRCYRDSRGKLGCISCHDPYRLPEPARGSRIIGVAAWNVTPLADATCLATPGCRRVRKTTAACHMPRMRTTNIAHTALTNHTIPLLPDSAR